MNLDFSFVIPVFNRPDEIRELLESFVSVSFPKSYEIVIVEDGSTQSSEEIVREYSDNLNISYYFKENTGPGDSRNFGMQRAKGNYFIILDSDCLIPSDYLLVVHEFLTQDYVDCYGGADAAHADFSPLQKAINYTMTSFLTTGGIRGSKQSVNKFEPRSFNMGISRTAFERTGGFGKIHPGEDPDLSQRMLKAGFRTAFISGAEVYHKRRISWKKFYTQVKKFGLVRPILNRWHPKSSKITFWFPTLFVLFVIGTALTFIFYHWWTILPLAIYVVLIFLDSSLKNRSIYIGILSVIAVFVQFFGYGLAFFKSSILVGLLNKEPKKQFPQLFFD